MIKVPITYEDFDGKTVTEDHYFHLKKVELIDMLAESGDEDLVAKLERIGKSGNNALIMKTFTEFIGAAYGQRVDGSGSEFYKSPEITAKFMGSLAFDQLLTNLMLDEVAAAAFINGLMPGDLNKLAAAVAEKAGQEMLPLPEEAATTDTGLKTPIWLDGEHKGELLPWALREPTEKELTSMSQPQLLDVMRRKNAGWTPHSSGVPATA